MNFYNKDTFEVLKDLDVDIESGLGSHKAKQLLEKNGKNEIKRGKEETWVDVLVDQFKSPIVIILFIAMVVSTWIQYSENAFRGSIKDILINYSEPLVIFILSAFNLILGYSQDLKAFNEAKKLTQFTASKTKVRRDGKVVEIFSDELVVGDIVILDQGASIKADLRLLEGFDLKVQESFLTGESEDILKTTEKLEGELEVQDQKNMLFSGGFITNGRGEAVVVATGFKTEIGKIVDQVDDTEKAESTLKKGLANLNVKLFFIAIGFVVLVVIFSLLRHFAFKDIFNNAVSMMVATMPEALPTVLTIVLTATSVRMVKEKALIKKSDLIEALGQVDVVCSDKTGTITEGNMHVVKYYDANNSIDVEEIKDVQTLELSALTLGASVEGKEIIGTPTEIAIARAAMKLNIRKEDIEANHYEIIDELAFSSVYKRSGVIAKDLRTSKYYVVFLGAFDFIINDCKYAGLDKNELNLEDATNKIKEYGSEALRTITIAAKEITKEEAQDAKCMDLSSDLSFLGVYGIIDPVKKEAITTIDNLHKAGINVVMITGDYPATAKQIAKNAHIITDDNAIVITGKELDDISDDELFNMVNDIKVYARVRPEHKVRIIKAFQKHNKVVAMTGDGVNDSIALKRSNIGIVMGQTGSDISKESGDLILLDDDFETIEVAVKEGRVVFENIRKFTRQLTTDNVAIAMSLIFSLAFSKYSIVALTPLSVLWVNTISDSIPSIALGFDGADDDIMQHPPRSKDEQIFTKSLLANIFIRGIMLGLFTFLGDELVFGWVSQTMSRHDAELYAGTVAFVILSFGALIHNFDARASRGTLFTKNPFTNKQLLWSLLASSVLNILVVYTPLSVIMGLKALPIEVFMYSVLIGFIPTLGVSAIKEIYLLITRKNK